jgi:hypothetical protein
MKEASKHKVSFSMFLTNCKYNDNSNPLNAALVNSKQNYLESSQCLDENKTDKIRLFLPKIIPTSSEKRLNPAIKDNLFRLDSTQKIMSFQTYRKLNMDMSNIQIGCNNYHLRSYNTPMIESFHEDSKRIFSSDFQSFLNSNKRKAIALSTNYNIKSTPDNNSQTNISINNKESCYISDIANTKYLNYKSISIKHKATAKKVKNSMNSSNIEKTSMSGKIDEKDEQCSYGVQNSPLSIESNTTPSKIKPKMKYSESATEIVSLNNRRSKALSCSHYTVENVKYNNPIIENSINSKESIKKITFNSRFCNFSNEKPNGMVFSRKEKLNFKKAFVNHQVMKNKEFSRDIKKYLSIC